MASLSITSVVDASAEISIVELKKGVDRSRKRNDYGPTVGICGERWPFIDP